MRDKLASRQDAQILAVDPHETWAARRLLKEVGFGKEDVEFPLLLDAANTVSATYGVAFQMRIHTEWCNRPATFVIDQNGVITFAQRGKSFSDRPTPAKILDVIDGE